MKAAPLGAWDEPGGAMYGVAAHHPASSSHLHFLSPCQTSLALESMIQLPINSHYRLSATVKIWRDLEFLGGAGGKAAACEDWGSKPAAAAS